VGWSVGRPVGRSVKSIELFKNPQKIYFKKNIKKTINGQTTYKPVKDWVLKSFIDLTDRPTDRPVTY